MKKIIAQEQNDWVLSASNWLQEKQKQYRAATLYIPAGETPKPLYRHWESEKPAYLNNLQLIQIDDVMTGSKKNIFKQFFYDELPGYADRIEYFDAGQTQADLGILGLGLNGHVAFHEPGLSESFYSGCVKLQEVTINNLELEPNAWGKTYGAGAFYKCKSLLIIVKGEKKKQILNKLLEARTNPRELPASALSSHPDITLLTDFAI